jgi:tripartite-type tricarboxylate transporter receptor subunit TctC
VKQPKPLGFLLDIGMTESTIAKSSSITPFTQRRRLIGAAGAAYALGPTLAWAQGFPARPLRIVVPFPPGGSTDLLARRLGERFAVAFGQPVVVENKPGAGGTIGADFVAKAAPDGTTVLMGVTGSNAVAASLYPKLPYDPVKDFAPISQVVSAPLVLAVPATSPIKSVRDYVAAARARPMNYASPGNGTSMHLTGEMFDQAFQLKMIHVPYKGSAAALNDLLGGTVQSMFGDVLVLMPQIKAGKLTALAVTSAKRHPLLPDVPTISESAAQAGLAQLSGFETSSWQGLFAPAGTPREIIARWNQETVKALEAAEIKDFFGAQGFLVAASTPEQFRAWVESEVQKWGRVIKAGNITAD